MTKHYEGWESVPDPEFDGKMDSDNLRPKEFDGERSCFMGEDCRVMPYSEGDIDLINRLEDAKWFGKNK